MTLIEMMIVVAIVGILAALAIFMFGRSATKARASEVRVMMVEFKAKQAAFYVENDTYTSTCNPWVPPASASCADDTDRWPATPAGSSNRNPVDWQNAEATGWRRLRLTLPDTNLYCSYVTIGRGNKQAAAAGDAVNLFGLNTTIPVPDQDWFYTLAHCNWDDDPALDSFYLTTSEADGMMVVNEGS